MLHKNILVGDNHVIHNWAVADLAARNALVVTAADKGKVAWQQDTNVFYFLSNDVGPVWLAALGVPGATGAAGTGVPVGGTANQVLAKIDATDYNTQWVAQSGGREVLSAGRTYFVRTDGSNANNGLANTAGGAFLTIQKAIDVVSTTLDMAGYVVTVQVADGTYTGNIVSKPLVGNNTLTVQGNTTTPSNVVISVTSLNAVESFVVGIILNVNGMKLQTTTSGSTMSTGGGIITFSNIVFGVCVGFHMNSQSFGRIVGLGNYSITGGAQNHMFAGSGGQISISSKTVTLTGAPNFSNSYAGLNLLGHMLYANNTFSGTATGKRYEVSMNAALYVNGAATTYLPGDVAGTTVTGGVYV